MADESMVTPEVAEFLTLMTEETCFPENWETCGLWLAQAQALAQFLADHRGKIGLSDAAMLVGLGGVLVEMAKREREAFDATARYFGKKEAGDE
ncbi:MAG: hypothetical protein KGJ57_04990 [Sphingomonadales bacterium]|nr:hypothetical protein [Sphingomonadales bacterium]MDE2168772.1 hypothetical protein [Sphingomonadales bacterium]